VTREDADHRFEGSITRPKPVRPVLEIGLTPMCPAIVVAPVVEIPDSARMVKWAALPRNTGTCKAASGVEYGDMSGRLGPCMTVSTPD
jgi:hypothetical protein